MSNIGPDIPALLGELSIVPPPGASPAEVGVFRKLRRGIKKAGRRIGKVAKKAGRVAVKIHTAPIKAVAKAGKFALMKAAQLAATPIRLMFKKLAMRRARLLSWRGRRSMKPSRAEKLQAVAWAIAAMNRKGPLGKFGVRILKFTKGATLGHSPPFGMPPGPPAEVGLTGAEIAAAAGAIASAIAVIMKSLNKPGQAPADPRQAEPAEEAAEATEAVEDATAETSGWVLGADPVRDKALLDALRAWHLSEHGPAVSLKTVAKAPSSVKGELPRGARGYVPYTWIGPAEAERRVLAYMQRGTAGQRFMGKAGLSREAAEAAVLRDLRAKKIGIRSDNVGQAGKVKKAYRRLRRFVESGPAIVPPPGSGLPVREGKKAYRRTYG